MCGLAPPSLSPKTAPKKEAAQAMPDHVDYSMLPDHMQVVAREYVENFLMPGDFLQAVLRNDLVAAFSRADATNAAAMQTWASWLYNECPSAAWGTMAKVEAWCLK